MTVPAWESVPQDPALLRDAMADLQARRAHEDRPSTGHFAQRCEALEAELAALKARVAALEAASWINSPEGRKAMAESLERANAICDEFREAQRVDPADLHKPVTI